MRRILGRDIPARTVDPTFRTRDYVDRRSGGIDDAALRRQQRAAAAVPVPALGAAIQWVGALLTSAAGLDFGRFYRQPHEAGVRSELVSLAVRGSGGTGTIETLMYGRCHEGSTTWDPGSIASLDDDGLAVTVSSEVSTSGDWTCTGSFTGIVGVGNNQWIASAFPTASGEVMFRVFNASGNSQNPVSGTVRVRCCRRS